MAAEAVRTRMVLGMLSVGLLSGGYGEDELRAAGAFRVYRDAQELRESLDELGIAIEPD